jgi:dienelactone hydrolase
MPAAACGSLQRSLQQRQAEVLAGLTSPTEYDLIEQHIDIATADGAMNSFVVHPEEGGPFPVVLFYMDAPGYREELRDMARRLASVGYFVVLPNLYYRVSRDFWLTERTETEMAQMFSLMATLDAATDAVRHRRDAALRRRQPRRRRPSRSARSATA